jgi:hypothetical protein
MFRYISSFLNDSSCQAPTTVAEGLRCLSSWVAVQPAIIAAVISTLIGGLIVSVLSSRWTKTQKQRELDFSTLEQFQQLYGEFFALYHLWDDFKGGLFQGIEGSSKEIAKDIIERAYNMEGKMEAVLTRIAAEKELSLSEIDSLGRCRQAFQRMRKHVSRDIPFNWNVDFHREYASLKIHAARVADIILFGRPRVPSRSKLQILDITSNRYETKKSSTWLLTDEQLSALKSERQRIYEQGLRDLLHS